MPYKTPSKNTSETGLPTRPRTAQVELSEDELGFLLDALSRLSSSSNDEQEVNMCIELSDRLSLIWAYLLSGCRHP